MNKKKLCIPILFTILFYTASVCAQSDSDTDPNRWAKVKSWEGSYSFTCKDSDTLQEGDATTIVTFTIDISGFYEMSWSSPTQPNCYSWQGNGNGHGTVNEVIESIQGDSNCTVVTSVDVPVAPIALTDTGYYLDWYPKGIGMLPANSYWLETGGLILPGTFTPCVGGTISQDWELGGGASGYVTLPASGYHLTGSREFEFAAQAPFRLTWIFSWDLKPKEFKPASSTPCPAEAIYGENSEQTELLRKYRDNVLSKTPEGRETIKTYYRFCPTVTKLLEQKPLLKNRAKAFIDSMLPGIKKKVEESNRKQ